jgi:hypothetical protein
MGRGRFPIEGVFFYPIPIKAHADQTTPVSSQNRRVKMATSSAAEPLLGASSGHPKYSSVNSEITTAVINVEPPGAHEAGHSDAYRAGSGCVSFHNVSYEVSGCFGLKEKKVILNSVR